MTRRMKKGISIVLTVLSLLAAVPAMPLAPVSAVTAEAASAKSGLKKEGGKYYYYQKGKKLKNAWKTIRVKKNGKTVSNRYYFGKTGAAYQGKKAFGETVLAYRKIKGNYYAFDAGGRMLRGICVKRGSNGRGVFYAFHSKTGVYDAAKTKKLRAVSKYGKNAAALRKLIGKPIKTVRVDGCYGSGKDLVLYYQNFTVTLYRDAVGKETILDLASR